MNELVSCEQYITPARFDYTGLDPETVAMAKAAAVTVLDNQQLMTTAMLEAGRALLAVKARLGHGNFGRWLAAELPNITDRTVRNYMSAAEQFGEPVISEMISVLPPTAVYKLASPTAAPVRDIVIEHCSKGLPVSTDMVEDLLSTERQKAKEAQYEASQTKARRQRLLVRNGVRRLTPEQEEEFQKKEERRRQKEERERQERQREIDAQVSPAIHSLEKLTTSELEHLHAIITGNMSYYLGSALKALISERAGRAA